MSKLVPFTPQARKSEGKKEGVVGRWVGEWLAGWLAGWLRRVFISGSTQTRPPPRHAILGGRAEDGFKMSSGRRGIWAGESLSGGRALLDADQ